MSTAAQQSHLNTTYLQEEYCLKPGPVLSRHPYATSVTVIFNMLILTRLCKPF